MHQFVFQQGLSGELWAFPHILELGSKKIQHIQLNSFPQTSCNCLRIFYIQEGKFEWTISGMEYMLFPGDAALVPPGMLCGNSRDILEIGAIAWINIDCGTNGDKLLAPKEASGLSDAEKQVIQKVLLMNESPVISKIPDAGRILFMLKDELQSGEIGYITRVKQLTDELLITCTRRLTSQNNRVRDFPKVFMLLEQQLRKDLSYQWTVEEMAAIAGMGTTHFNDKVKAFTGFTPLNYLINIRVSEAMKMLKKDKVVITDIALETGFYSSQHFATTFKKLTGYTPSEFRKNYFTGK